MEVLQVGYNFIDKALVFSVGIEKVKSISITDQGNAVIKFTNDSTFTIKEKYVMSYTTEKALVSEPKNLNLDEFYKSKNKKKFKHLKR